MSKIKFKITIEPPKARNIVAVDAMMRRSNKFKDRRDKRKQSRNWRHQDWSNE